MTEQSDYLAGSTKTYRTVFGMGHYIIDDACPSVSDVVPGCRVCIRAQTVPTVVKEDHNNMNQFSVQLIGPAVATAGRCSQDMRLVKLVDIHLLKPPWWDELEETVAAVESARKQLIPVNSKATPVQVFSYHGEGPTVVNQQQQQQPPITIMYSNTISITQGRGVPSTSRYGPSQQETNVSNPSEQNTNMTFLPSKRNRNLWC